MTKIEPHAGKIGDQNFMSWRKFAGIPIAHVDSQTSLEVVHRSALDSDSGHSFHFVNAYTISLTYNDEVYRECISASSGNFPDGKPLSILTRFANVPLRHVRGPEFFTRMMSYGLNHGLRHYFLGGDEETLRRIRVRAEKDFPGIKIAGSFSPPFRTCTESELRQQDEAIRQAAPHIIWVGLGTPKQDFEARRLASEGFTAVAIGAAFDFFAGSKPEAPKWVTALGLEWLFRLASEPRRLWRRYLIGNMTFLRAVAMRRD